MFHLKKGTIGWSVSKPHSCLFNFPATYSTTFNLAGMHGSSSAWRSIWNDELCGCFDFGWSFKWATNFFTSGHISFAQRGQSSFSYQRWPQYGKGYMQVSVTFSNSSLRAGASSSSFQAAVRIFSIFQLEFLTLAFMLPCTVCRPQVPICINGGSSFDSLLTLGPSVDIRIKLSGLSLFIPFFKCW